jgi:hypothetical protein
MALLLPLTCAQPRRHVGWLPGAWLPDQRQVSRLGAERRIGRHQHRDEIAASGQDPKRGAWLPRVAPPGPVWQQRQLLQEQLWNFTGPLRVCTASMQDFGARCNGAPDPSLEGQVQPVGPVPPKGWCPVGENFCGYDVAVFECAAPSTLALLLHQITML